MQYLLAIDLGTTSCKAGLFTASGQLLATGRAPYPTRRPVAGAAEQEPAAWWRATRAAVRMALQRAGASPEAVGAVGLSGQSPTLCLVDAAGRALTPGFTWQDARGGAAVGALQRAPFAPRLESLTGAGVPLAPAWPLPRLQWVRTHWPEAWQRAAHAMQPKDYVYFRLTGLPATDAATWRGLVHLVQNTVAPELLAWLDAPRGLIPPAYPPSAMPGRLTRAATSRLGLRAGTPVAVGWPDSWSHVAGVGLDTLAGAFDVTGTSEVVGALGRRPGRPGGVTTMPMIAGLYLAYGGTSAGGGALEWFVRSVLGARGGWDRARERALAAAAATPPGAEDLVFLPYLAGERVPLWDPQARGTFVGLQFRHATGHLVRAVLEGVAFSIRHVVESASNSLGVAVQNLVVSGGASRNALWNQIKADVLGIPVRVTEVAESGLLGSAMIAAVGLGWYPDLPAACRAMVRPLQEITPQPAHRALYDRLYGVYTELYPALRAAYHDLAAGKGAGAPQASEAP